MQVDKETWNNVAEAAITKSKLFMYRRQAIEDKKERQKMRTVAKILSERGMYYVYRIKENGQYRTHTNLNVDLVRDAVSRSRLKRAVALKRQLQRDGRMTNTGLCTVSCGEDNNWTQRYWDEMSGKELDIEGVKQARKEELEYVKS